jgi:hypothetical protein
MLDLPPELERQLAAQISKFEEENHMPYVTSIERLGIEKGSTIRLKRYSKHGLGHRP